jgi:putative hemolysin
MTGSWQAPLASMQFPELTYSNPTDPWLTRTTIRFIELMAGRNYFVPLYRRWRDEVIPSGGPIMPAVFELCDVELDITGAWPQKIDPASPLVIIANHPFGILDGFAALHIAESLGRPFKVLINKDLLKVPEIRPYSLPVDFSETREAVVANIKMRNEALRLLKEGTTIVVFPSGGVATAPDIGGKAVDLPWKTFTARMILAARAQVLPMYFEGQCRPLFHFVSRYSLTLRLSLIIAEFRRMVGTRMRLRIGGVVPFAALRSDINRRQLIDELYERVHALSDEPLADIRAREQRLPAWLRGTDGD